MIASFLKFNLLYLPNLLTFKISKAHGNTLVSIRENADATLICDWIWSQTELYSGGLFAQATNNKYKH